MSILKISILLSILLGIFLMSKSHANTINIRKIEGVNLVIIDDFKGNVKIAVPINNNIIHVPDSKPIINPTKIAPGVYLDD